MIQIEFSSVYAGWLCWQVKVADIEYYFTYSYITNFLDDLLKTLLNIDNQLGNKMHLERFLTYCEPAVDDWYFVKDNQKLNITITRYEDESRGNKVKTIEIDCGYYEFVEALIQGLTVFLKKVGLYAYHIEWGQEFPLSYYLKLKDICQKKQQIILKKLIVDDTYEQTGRVSNIFKELDLLTQTIGEKERNNEI